MLNKFKYLKANDNVTGSSISNIVLSSIFSESWDFNIILPVPLSPEILNLTYSFDVSIVTVSANVANSLQIRVNSADGRVTTEP